MTGADIQKRGAAIIPFPSQRPSQTADRMFGTAQCPCCAGALNIAEETVIAVNDVWLTWRKRVCVACDHSITTTEIPAGLAIDALKGLSHA